MSGSDSLLLTLKMTRELYVVKAVGGRMIDNTHVASLLRRVKSNVAGVSNKSLERRLRSNGVTGLSASTIHRLAKGQGALQRSHELDASEAEGLRQRQRGLLGELAGIWYRKEMPEGLSGGTLTDEQLRRIAVYAHILEHIDGIRDPGVGPCSCEPSYWQIDAAISVGWSAFQCDALHRICLFGADRAHADPSLERFIDYLTMGLRARRPAFNPNRLAPERWSAKLQGIICPEIVSDRRIADSLARFCREVSNWYLGASNALSSFDKWHRVGFTLALLGADQNADLDGMRLLHNEGMRLYRMKEAAAALPVFEKCHDYFCSRDHPRQFRLSDESAENLLLIHLLNKDESKAREMFALLEQRPETELNYWGEVGLQVTAALFFDSLYGKSERHRVSRHLERADKLHRSCNIRLKPVLHLPGDNALDRFICEPETDRFEIFKGYRQPILEIGENLPIQHELESIYNLLQKTLEEIKATPRSR